MWQKTRGWAWAAPRESLFSECLLLICTKVAGALLPKEWIGLPETGRRESTWTGRDDDSADLLPPERSHRPAQLSP